MKYSNEELMTMYRTMVEGRMFDLELDRQNNQGKLSGMFHFSINQEAIGTAVAHALLTMSVYAVSPLPSAAFIPSG